MVAQLDRHECYDPYIVGSNPGCGIFCLSNVEAQLGEGIGG